VNFNKSPRLFLIFFQIPSLSPVFSRTAQFPDFFRVSQTHR